MYICPLHVPSWLSEDVECSDFAQSANFGLYPHWLELTVDRLDADYSDFTERYDTIR